MTVTVARTARTEASEILRLWAAIKELETEKSLEIFWFVGDTSETDFALPKGWKPKFVYEAGALFKEGSGDEYTVTFDGYVYTVVFAVAPAAVDLGIIAERTAL